MYRSRISKTIVTLAAAFAAQNATASSLTISEVLYNEVGSSFTGEWIEIYNGTNAAIDLSNYKIGDEETLGGTTETEVMSQFPAGALIAPGEVQILASFSSRFQEVYGFRPTYEYGSSVATDNWVDDTLVPNMTVYTAWDADGAKLNMANTNDQVLLLDPADASVDAVNWGNTVFLNPGAPQPAGDGQTIERLQTDLDSDTSSDWALTVAAPANVFWTSRSTPGTVNLAPTIWSGDTDGLFSDASQFTVGAIENTYGRVVKFGSSITADRAVTLDVDQTLYSVVFDSAVSSYTLAGTSTLTLSSGFGGSKLSVVAGSHTISAPVTFVRTGVIDVASEAQITLSGPLTATGANLTKTGGGRAVVTGIKAESLSVLEGRVAIEATTPAAAATSLKTLSVASGASLDLNSAALVLDYEAAQASPLAEVNAMIADGRLLSTEGMGDSRKAIGTADTAVSGSLTEIDGIVLDGSAVVAKLTFKGDTNLDAAVTFDDLLALAQNYNSTTGSWSTGDSNRDGNVDFDDLLALAQNYGAGPSLVSLQAAGIGADFIADWNFARAISPEPGTFFAMAGGAALLRRRR